MAKNSTNKIDIEEQDYLSEEQKKKQEEEERKRKEREAAEKAAKEAAAKAFSEANGVTDNSAFASAQKHTQKVAPIINYKNAVSEAKNEHARKVSEGENITDNSAKAFADRAARKQATAQIIDDYRKAYRNTLEGAVDGGFFEKTEGPTARQQAQSRISENVADRMEGGGAPADYRGRQQERLSDNIINVYEGMDRQLRSDVYDSEVDNQASSMIAEWIYSPGAALAKYGTAAGEAVKQDDKQYISPAAAKKYNLGQNLAERAGADDQNGFTAGETIESDSGDIRKAIGDWILKAYEDNAALAYEEQANLRRQAALEQSETPLGDIALNLATSLNNMAVSAGYSAVTGMPLSSYMAFTGGADKTADYLEAGYNPLAAIGAGVAWGKVMKEIEGGSSFGHVSGGIVDTATKKIGNEAVKLAGKFVDGKTIATVVDLAKGPIAKRFFSGLGEGLEEVVEYNLEYVFDSILGRDDVSFDVKEMLYSGLLGTLCGELFEFSTAYNIPAELIYHFSEDGKAERAADIKEYLDRVDPKILESVSTGDLKLVEDVMKNIPAKIFDKAIPEGIKKALGEARARNGEVYFEEGVDRRNLSDIQKTSVNALKAISKALGVKFYLYESPVVDGMRKGANGYYDQKDGSIHLDIFAGLNTAEGGKATMLFTAAHELTHFIRQWNGTKFDEFADFLLSEYGQQGISVDDLVNAQIGKAARNGRTIDPDTALEEVIADSMETMLSDGSIIEKLENLKAQDRNLWEKIRDFFTDLAGKIKNAYEGLEPNSPEGRYVAKMKDEAERIQELFYEGLVGAGESYKKADIISPSKRFVNENQDIRYSEKDFQIKKDVEDLVHRAATGTTTTMHKVGIIDATLNKAINRLENQANNGGYKGKYEGGERLVSDTAIRHTLSQHGDFLTEALRAQFPMTEKDIARHLSAVKDGKTPTRIEASSTKQGNASILTAYEINGYTLYAEEIKKPLEKNSPSGLIGHTMYKAPTLSTAPFGTTSVTNQPKRQSLVLCEYNNTQNGNLSTGNFVADYNGEPAKLEYIKVNNAAKQAPRLLGLIALSSDASNFTDNVGNVESGYVLCKKPFYITPENRVFSNSDSDIAQIIMDLRHKGYDCFVFDKSVGDNYMVAVFNKEQIISQKPTIKEDKLYQDRPGTEDNKSNFGQDGGFGDIEEKPVFAKGEAEGISAEINASARRVLDLIPKKDKVQSTTGQVNFETEATKATNLVSVPQSKKSERIERRYIREATNAVAAVFGVQPSDIKGDLRPIVEEISTDLKAGKEISEEQINRLYETAFADGLISEEFPQYSETRKFIRENPIYVDKETRNEFGDDYSFREFAASNSGSLKISSNPRDVSLDDIYASLAEMAPEFFDSSEIDPKTQLEDIADFLSQTKRQYYGLSEVYSGETLADFEAFAKKELYGYMKELGKGMDNIRRYELDRQIKATNKAREIDPNASFEAAKAVFSDNRVFLAQKELDRAKANAVLSEADKITVKRLLEGAITEDEVIFRNEGNVEGILSVYKAEKNLKDLKEPFERYRIAYKDSVQHDAIKATEFSDDFTDKKIGILYSRETAERNILDITGNGKYGGREIIEEYFKPVHENEAAKTRWINEMNRRASEIGFGKMNRYERAYTQMIGENAAYIAEGKITKHNQIEHERLNGKIEELLLEHGNKIDKAKCEKAAAGFIEIYEDILSQWNDERIRRGQEPVGRIELYFPHFTEAKPKNLIQKIFSALGFDIGSSKLPTDIAGRTADRKPNSKYNPHAKKRKADVTDYDVLKGFDNYLRAVGDNIFHTEDIQKLRALSDTIRTKYSSEELAARIEKIQERNDYSDADKDILIAEAYKTQPGAFHLSNFVTWLDEYTNILAGKKSRGDRETEYQMGREIYDISKAIEGRIASNMIGGNISTSVMNFVPLFQATADIDPIHIIYSVLQTGVSALRGDSYISDNSDFITNRLGADSLYKQNFNLFTVENTKDFVSKLSDGAGFLMEFVDRITSESLVRARVQQNLRNGKTTEEAFAEADQWAAGLIADRSLGALPTVFNAKNPIAKMFTMFQVEANNQYSYIFKDAGKYKLENNGAASMILGQIAFWLSSAICKALAGELLGRDNVVPDPIGLTYDAYNKLRNGEEVGDVILDLAGNAVEQAPFIGGLLGGGRVPFSTAMPDLENLLKLSSENIDAKKKGQILLDSLFKPLSYIFMPTGAGQLWKTGKGINQLLEGGAYGIENDGSEYLKFPQEYDTESILKTILFGQYASDRGQDYIDSGFKDKLSAKQTEQMKLAENWGISNEEFYDLALGLKEYDKKEDKQEALFANENFTSGEKGILEQILFGDNKYGKGYDSRDYYSEDSFYRSGLSEGGKNLFDAGYSREDIETVEEAVSGNGKKAEEIGKIAEALGISEAEAFKVYQERNGDWVYSKDDLSEEDKVRAQNAYEFYGANVDEYIKVLNYSKYGVPVEKEDGSIEYSTSMKDVVPNLAKVLNVTEKRAEELYLRVNAYDYSRADIEEEEIKNLDTAGGWYEVDDKGYFVAKNAILVAEGEKDKYGNTIEGSSKKEAIANIAKQLGIDEEEATIYYLAAEGELALSIDDLSSSHREDLETAIANGWTERQYLDAVNIVRVSGASKKAEVIKALMDAGAPYAMAQGYYNLREDKDYNRYVGKLTIAYGMSTQKQADKIDYFIANYNSSGDITAEDLAKWIKATKGKGKKADYIAALIEAGAPSSLAEKIYALMKGYDKSFKSWYQENGG